MNEQTEKFWNDYWANQGQLKPEKVEAFQFGAEADWLADLVVEGKKTATCSAHVYYEIENEPLPHVGQYNIVLDAKEEPVAIIRVTEVSMMPMNEVPVEFALAEGEGDFEFWWNAHKNFFKSELGKLGLEYSESMQLVCERFETLHTK
ncbi:ASCH domain-containing protein [Planococcus halotolerans]|uniref:ASCH domain-containing protein n=1 Tax=Planococcus halotolerans TaxID=2233542 RepID=A0A365L7M8_9BACL|nr:ASCH domain-containing protein [Planococcus halotolerans]QHJ69900.1 ASCH domain-containing protein [Planococcus halotolerans]RAZ81408.1 ASCH domain-containing protein [Planococcus halotolerans]